MERRRQRRGNRCGGLEVEADEGSSSDSDLRFERKLKRFDGQIRRWLVLLWRRKRGRRFCSGEETWFCSFNSAQQMFDKMFKRYLLSWNVMITDFIPDRLSYRLRFDLLLCQLIQALQRRPLEDPLLHKAFVKIVIMKERFSKLLLGEDLVLKSNMVKKVYANNNGGCRGGTIENGRNGASKLRGIIDKKDVILATFSKPNSDPTTPPVDSATALQIFLDHISISSFPESTIPHPQVYNLLYLRDLLEEFVIQNKAAKVATLALMRTDFTQSEHMQLRRAYKYGKLTQKQSYVLIASRKWQFEHKLIRKQMLINDFM
ncbi:hypothetical protein L1987_16583 [Smallanthus sonchifolius]|uniref:Uncharacterized protein n=1 Tax=Smallanthus sonchifolius TaxID=185202 RepID=A0ACB9IXZ8_9ASTR|nr:hypothetical protein L1987_16583 [Smallanthus sonchifolius]